MRLCSTGSRLLTHGLPEDEKTQVDTMCYELLLALRKFSQTAVTRLRD